MTTNEVTKTNTLSNVTREGLLAAMKEYDRVGADAFHAKHGTSPSRDDKYNLRHGGKVYPSKAIVAAAAGLSPKNFSGGQSRLGKLLARAGFTLGVLAMAHASSKVVEAAQTAPARNGQALWQGTDGKLDCTYFASGSNTPACIRGFAAVGQAIGVAAPHVTANSESELMALAGTGIPVFVDSGAFSEVEFTAEGPKVVKPMTAAKWQSVLDLYARLGAVLGSQLYVVAPDKVGFQGETLERLEAYKAELQALISNDVNVMVVAQGGPAMSQAEFDAKAQEILGTDSYVRALPCNKNATSPAAVRAFAEARKPAKLHLLGLGLRADRAPACAEAVAAVSPETQLSFDSCLLAESAGSTNGRTSHPEEKKGGPRVLTKCLRKAKAFLAKGLARGYISPQELAVKLAFGATSALVREVEEGRLDASCVVPVIAA